MYVDYVVSPNNKWTAILHTLVDNNSSYYHLANDNMTHTSGHQQ